MYYTVYKITNTINGKEYIGAHKTSDLDDGYTGSGINIRRAQNKYGIENFSKEIIFRANSSKAMYFIEKMLVDNEYVKRKDTYNIKLGGYGGFDYINKSDEYSERRIEKNRLARKIANENGALEKAVKACKYKYKNDKGWVENKVKKHKESITRYYETHHGVMYGKNHTEETKEKMSLSHKGKGMGKDNSQHGTMWIHNIDLQETKKINRNADIPKGWEKGKLKLFCNKCKRMIASGWIKTHTCISK